jgi:hypothetical protein
MRTRCAPNLVPEETMAPIPELHQSLATLFSELMDGPPAGASYVLNPKDPGLLRSLDQLSAGAASTPSDEGSAPIAAHVDHVCYGMELMNRWTSGEQNPWATADWTASWRRGQVNEEEWSTLRERLRSTSKEFLAGLSTPRELPGVARNGMIAGVVHLAYHMGAIRQIDRSIRGPSAEE